MNRNMPVCHRHKSCHGWLTKGFAGPVEPSTWSPSTVRERWFYLYVILDLYSRKITGYDVHKKESSEPTEVMIQRNVICEGCWRQPLVLHADNGTAMRGGFAE